MKETPGAGLKLSGNRVQVHGDTSFAGTGLAQVTIRVTERMRFSKFYKTIVPPTGRKGHEMLTAKRILMGLAVVAGAAALTACGGGTNTGNSNYYGTPAYKSWYNVYGSYCGSNTPRPGCNFYANGDKIIDTEDPYASPSNLFVFDTYGYTDSYGVYRTYTGYVWTSPTGILYTDLGDALNSKDGEGKDVISDVAEAEQDIVQSVGEMFAAKYNLSADVGVHVATVLNDWAVLAKTKSRTQSDVEAFTKRLYGVNFNDVQAALMEYKAGDKGALSGVIGEAAANWATTPETMKEIISDWYGDQL